MKKELFQKYSQLKNTIKELQEEVNVLEPELMNEMKESGAEKVESDFGLFTIVPRKAYQYSDVVKSMETVLKDKKKEEEKNGVAQVSINTSLRYTSKKDELNV